MLHPVRIVSPAESQESRQPLLAFTRLNCGSSAFIGNPKEVPREKSASYEGPF